MQLPHVKIPRLPRDGQSPVSITPQQRGKEEDQPVEPLVVREPADPDHRLDRMWRRGVLKFRDVDAVLDADQAARPDTAKLALVDQAHCGDTVVPDHRYPRYRGKVDLLEPRGERRMEKSAVGGDDKLLVVQRLGPGQKVEEEIDGMHVNDVGISDVLQGRRGDRITRRSDKRYPDNFDPGDRLARGKLRGYVGFEQPVQRYDSHRVALASLSRGELPDDALEATDGRIKLANHVHDTHADVPQYAFLWRSTSANVRSRISKSSPTLQLLMYQRSKSMRFFISSTCSVLPRAP